MLMVAVFQVAKAAQMLGPFFAGMIKLPSLPLSGDRGFALRLGSFSLLLCRFPHHHEGGPQPGICLIVGFRSIDHCEQ